MGDVGKSTATRKSSFWANVPCESSLGKAPGSNARNSLFVKNLAFHLPQLRVDKFKRELETGTGVYENVISNNLKLDGASEAAHNLSVCHQWGC